MRPLRLQYNAPLEEKYGSRRLLGFAMSRGRRI